MMGAELEVARVGGVVVLAMRVERSEVEKEWEESGRVLPPVGEGVWEEEGWLAWWFFCER